MLLVIIFQFSGVEWIVIVLATVVMISLELVNSAIERVVDLITDGKPSVC